MNPSDILITIGIDFDGTIVDHEFPFIGKPVPHAIETIKWLQTLGYVEIILHTMRSDNMSVGDCLTPAIEYLERSGIVFDQINNNVSQYRWTDSPKVYCNCYIDDSAIGCPLITVPNFTGPCVDWVIIKRILTKKFQKFGWL